MHYYVSWYKSLTRAGCKRFEAADHKRATRWGNLIEETCLVTKLNLANLVINQPKYTRWGNLIEETCLVTKLNLANLVINQPKYTPWIIECSQKLKIVKYSVCLNPRQQRHLAVNLGPPLNYSQLGRAVLEAGPTSNWFAVSVRPTVGYSVIYLFSTATTVYLFSTATNTTVCLFI